MSTKPPVGTREKQMAAQVNQSLFQVLYLGRTAVHQFCSHAIMPWIAEELKLKTERRTLTWLTCGDSGVSYVADSGVELFRHSHSTILRCATGTDGITFSYIIQEVTGQYSCHVFQCLTPEEAAQLMKKFRMNAKGDKVSTSSPTNLPPTTHNMDYVGYLELKSSASTRSNHLLDNVLEKFYKRQRKTSRNEGRVPQLKRFSELDDGSSGDSMEVLNLPKSSANSNTAESDAVQETSNDSHSMEIPSSEVPSPLEAVSVSHSEQGPDQDSISSQSIPSLTDRQMYMTKEDSCDVSILLTRATPERMFDNVVGGEEEGEGEREGENLPGPPPGKDSLDSTPSTDDGEQSLQNSEPLTSNLSTLGGSDTTSQSPEGQLYNSDESESSASCMTPDPTLGDVTPTGISTPVDSDSQIISSAALNSSMRSSSSADNLISKQCESERSETKDRRKGVGRSHSFERPRPTQNERDSRGGRKGVENEDTDIGYDILPELKSLEQSPEFQALGSPSWSGKRGKEEVRLVISPNMVEVVHVKTSKVILRRTIRSIVCCAQSEKKPGFVGFVCREDQTKTFICHIFKGASQTMATAVMDSFKSSFVQAINSSPTAMCDTCPLQQLHSLCQNLEGVPTPVAQSRIQECLAQLSEADYNSIMREYKSSEHADHEFTQLVVLVSLIREHLQKKQEGHFHPIHNVLDTSSTQQQPPKPSRLSKLERAKLALASSFDNLRRGNRGTEKHPEKMTKSLTIEDTSSTVSHLVTEKRHASVGSKPPAKKPPKGKKNGLERSSSARTSVVKESGDSSGGEEMRSRRGSWLQRLRGPSAVTSSQEDMSDYERQPKAEGEEEKTDTSPLTSPLLQEHKKIKPAQKLEKFDSKEDLTSELSAPPLSSSLPSSSPPPSIPANFTTPTRTPMWRKNNMRIKRFHTKSSFSPPPAEIGSPSYVKYRREHKRSESMTWRHDIFESVTPVKERNQEKSLAFQDWEIIEPASFDQLGRSASVCNSVMGGAEEGEQAGRGSPRPTPRERWCRAIEQQIMLQRMEKENQSIMKASTEADTKRLKLCYKDPSITVDSMSKKWAEVLSRPHPPELSELKPALIEGVIPGRRGEVWSLLIQLYQERHPSLPPPSPLSHSLTLSQLCQKSTDHENSIKMDLGRTFPSHPYFSSVGKRGGQRALANILHAYAVADEDTGYCQGLSFVAGMILMHTKDEESAYKMLCQMMHIYSYRDVYAPDFSVLQLRLYQLSRLLHDELSTLHSHFTRHDITPFYYAAPWFLTLFASQYPIAFVARVMDLFFLDGPDIVFKVAVALLRYYESQILECSSMESISEFLKEQMPRLVLKHMVTILKNALRMDLGSKLQSFETEYSMYRELTASFDDEEEATDLKSLNDSYKRRNKELIEQLACLWGTVSSLESNVASLQETVREQQKIFQEQQETIRKHQEIIDRLIEAQALPPAHQQTHQSLEEQA